MERLMKNIVYALRFIRKHPGFALLVVLCLALGIGVNSAIFSIIDAVLLRPLPYRDPDQLVVLLDIHRAGDGSAEEYGASSPNFVAWRQRNQVFEKIEALETREINLTIGDEPERVNAGAVSAGFFDVLGVKTVLGRTFLPEEDTPNGPNSVVISHGLWQRRFGGSPGVLGESFVIDGKSYRVVGVLQPGFRLPQEADLWIPLGIDPANPPQKLQHYLFVVARRKPGIDLATARANLTTLAAALAKELPDTNAGWEVKVVDLRENLVGDIRHNLLVLLAAVGFVLLIACANVGNLLLTRAMERQGEIAVRAAFGARRTDLVRQMLTESLVLSLAGGAVGVFLAKLIVGLLPSIAPSQVALFRDVQIDSRVLLFTLAAAILTGILPALLPVAKSSNPELYLRLREGSGRTSTGLKERRIQRLLVIAEMALAMVLLVCAGLMIKSFSRLNRLNPGFDPDHVLTLQISLPQSQYAAVEKTSAFWRDLIGRLETLPGVVAAGATTALPVNEDAVTTVFRVENRAPASAGEVLLANFRRVTPDYFRTLKIPLAAGRTFAATDDAHATPVAIVSREMARRYWPDQDPVGRRIQRAADVASGRFMTVVGVVGDVQDSALGADLGSTFYVPITQGGRPTMNLVLRTTVPPLTLTSAVRKAVQAIDRNQPIAGVTTLDAWVGKSLSKRRFSTLVLTLFAALGVMLAMIGIYGVLSYSVSQRTQEIGIRMALGAAPRDVLRLVIGQGLFLALTGLVLGTLGGLLATRVLGSMLFEVEPTDPSVYLLIGLGLTAVAVGASYLPARRAGRLDPLTSLKYN